LYKKYAQFLHSKTAKLYSSRWDFHEFRDFYMKACWEG